MTPRIRKQKAGVEENWQTGGDAAPAPSGVHPESPEVGAVGEADGTGSAALSVSMAAGAFTPASWRAVGAVETGAAHLQAGLPCQDALAYRLISPGEGQPGWLIAALADGAGSAEHSQRGAQTATLCVVDYLEVALNAEQLVDDEGWRALMLDAFAGARAAVLALAEGEENPGRSFATTLACLVAGNDLVCAATLGDGMIVAEDQDGELFSFAKPQRGEYANETVFLTQEDALDWVQITLERRPLQSLAMFSDGLMRLALSIPEHQPFRPFFAPLFAFAASPAGVDRMENGAANERLREFLASERVNARTDDDKTLLLAVRR